MHIAPPASVTAINDWAFAECISLKDVHLTEGLETIAEEAFKGCKSLFRVTVPCTVVSVGWQAFADCISLTEVHLSDGLVVVIGIEAFAGCISLTEVHLPDGLETISDGAFEGCKSLLRIAVPSTTVAIGINTFAGCISLKEAEFCEGLQTIGSQAFSWCKSLLNLHVPATVTVIEDGAFEHCSLLRNITSSPSSVLDQVHFEQVFTTFAEVDCTFDMLRNRFNDLPLHKLCSVLSRRTLVCHDELRYLLDNFELPPGYGFPVDCLGMTPLHILACSGNHHIQLYRSYLERFPEAMLVKDKWGEAPLGYIILSHAPKEIIRYFWKLANESGMHCRSILATCS